VTDLPTESGVACERAAELFKLLGDRTRLRLLYQLIRNAEASAGALSSAVGLRAPALSNQLRLLTDCGIVASRRARTTIYYRIVDPYVSELLKLALRCVEGANARHVQRNSGERAPRSPG
jgi:DNA-binding transcriptional ArsR family regulator